MVTTVVCVGTAKRWTFWRGPDFTVPTHFSSDPSLTVSSLETTDCGPRRSPRHTPLEGLVTSTWRDANDYSTHFRASTVGGVLCRLVSDFSSISRQLLLSSPRSHGCLWCNNKIWVSIVRVLSKHKNFLYIDEKWLNFKTDWDLWKANNVPLIEWDVELQVY